ncbi:hypothetical protein M409DRAFT_20457 [Zasmidium cellare ATCC 36951]|uniref:Uncharacterized protein n=1 Tax=Zasmidium cellare ATCC 36951 TaxID=1080233 RepID=A0A6A6CRB0_ZASCE|nr:uncharacterized protein M409DRAFT_20457 [Zasmidium cellare ATCC 36951]KAF2169233.1 hypothetical protein M409DRAFT_20457 [Zasmidium cellare ATCC 36951]
MAPRVPRGDPSDPTLLGLPIELRRMIFWYLLRGEEETQAATKELRRVYHPAILRVNGQLHDEAEQYLYDENVFVLVKFGWKGFASVTQQQTIPVVVRSYGSKQHLKLPKNIAAQLALEYGGDEHWFAHEGAQGPKNDEPAGTFVILWSDLSKLMAALSWRIDAMVPPRIYSHDTDCFLPEASVVSRGSIKEASAIYSFVVRHGILNGHLSGYSVSFFRQPGLQLYAQHLARILNDAALSAAYLALRQLDGNEALQLLHHRVQITASVTHEWRPPFYPDILPHDNISKWYPDRMAYEHIALLIKLFKCGDETVLANLLLHMRHAFQRVLSHEDREPFWKHDIAMIENVVAGDAASPSLRLKFLDFIRGRAGPSQRSRLETWRAKKRLMASSALAMPLRLDLLATKPPDPALRPPGNVRWNRLSPAQKTELQDACRLELDFDRA